MTATFYIGDALEVMAKLPENSVDLVLSSPPFLALRSYLPSDHPDKAKEGGSQATPGEYIDWLVGVAEACARVLAPHGSLCFELGDTYAGSSAIGGDEARGGVQLTGRNQLRGDVAGIQRQTEGWPLPKSLSLIPELFRLTLVYGTNPLTGRQTDRWRLRNVIRWVRPNPPVGALGDKFRPATSELMVFCKSAKRYFDLDAVREPHKDSTVQRNQYRQWVSGSLQAGPNRGDYGEAGRDFNSDLNPVGAPPLDWWEVSLIDDEAKPYGPKLPKPPNPETLGRSRDGYNAVRAEAGLSSLSPSDGSMNPLGAPPLDWWNIPPGGYEGAHYAVFPPELCVRPIKAMSPETVCQTCGEPRRRIVGSAAMMAFQPELAAHIRERRQAAGISTKEANAWFPATKSNWFGHWEDATSQPLLPTPEQWQVIKPRLGLSDEFDVLIEPRNTAVYRTEDGDELVGDERRDVYDRGGVPQNGSRLKAGKEPDQRFSDCGHDNYRPGLVLDPFAGSGTTLAVATGHGRQAIGIDLDERNYDLALERVGPMFLQRGEVEA